MGELENTNEEGIIAYLLGELPEDQAERFERRYLEDQNLFQRLEEIEDELVDDYVSGTLPSARQTAFENHFLRTAGRSEKVEFARAMTERAVLWKKTRDTEVVDSSRILDEHSSDAREKDTSLSAVRRTLWSRPVPRLREWTAIAAALLFAVSSAFLWFRVSSLQNQLVAVKREEAALRQSESETRKNAGELQGQLSEEQKQSQALEDKINELEKFSSLDTPSRVIYAVQLGIDYLLGDSKGNGPPKIKSVTIPSGTSLIRIAVEFPKSEFQSFKANLRRSDRTIVWTRGGLKAHLVRDNQSISLAIPADRMPNGDYDLVVSGVNSNGDTESVAHYSLKVERKD
jgi:hypothetical protein